MIRIDSVGGDVYAALRMCEALTHAKEEYDVRVCTVVTGRAFSAAALLFAMGDERVVQPLSTLMYHQVSSDVGDATLKDMAIEMRETQRLNQLIKQVVIASAPDARGFFDTSSDTYVDARKAVKLGLATERGYALIRTTCTVSHALVVKRKR